MNDIIIKQAQEKDIHTIESILLDAVNWLNDMGEPLWKAEDMVWDKLSKSYQIESFYIAEFDEQPAGCVVVLDYDPFFWPDVKKGESLFIHKLAVRKAARNKGIADALINYTKELAKQKSVLSVRLDCDAMRPKQRAVYEKHDFICVEEKNVGVGRVYKLAMYVYKLPDFKLACTNILNTLNKYYPMSFDSLEQLREGGSTSYAVFSGYDKYFLRNIKPAFFETAIMGVDVQVFLQGKGFPVPPVVRTKDGLLFVKTENELYILYKFIEGKEPDPEQDAESIGELVGKLHTTMKDYCGKLVKQDKQFFINRYIDILKKKEYPKTSEFLAYGESLWDKVKNLPRGYCHGDMYSGNIHKTPEGELYILDFDTSCDGFVMYDPTLLCNKTHYFDFDECGYGKSREILTRFLMGYLKYNNLSQTEIDAFYDLIALYHFALQATIIEIHGLDCVGNAFLDKQLDWLYRWREQCEREESFRKK